MNVDTGAFQSLTDQVAGLAEQVRQMADALHDDAASRYADECKFHAGFAAGQDSIRKSVGVPVRSRAERPARTAARGHLRPVQGGQR